MIEIISGILLFFIGLILLIFPMRFLNLILRFYGKEYHGRFLILNIMIRLIGFFIFLIGCLLIWFYFSI